MSILRTRLPATVFRVREERTARNPAREVKMECIGRFRVRDPEARRTHKRQARRTERAYGKRVTAALALEWERERTPDAIAREADEALADWWESVEPFAPIL